MAKDAHQVTTKDPKKVEAIKRLAEHNCRKREQMKVQREIETKITYYGAGAILAIGVLGVIGYYAYQSRTPVNQTNETPANKFEMD